MQECIALGTAEKLKAKGLGGGDGMAFYGKVAFHRVREFLTKSIVRIVKSRTQQLHTRAWH